MIGRNLFKKETNLQLFVGLKVTLSTGESGVIEGGFGQSGKFKIRIPGEDFPVSVRWSRSAQGSFCLRSLIHTHTHRHTPSELAPSERVENPWTLFRMR